MTLADFRATLAADSPPAVSPALRALWHDGHGDWAAARMRSNGIAACSATRRTASASPSNRHRTTSSSRMRSEPR